MASFDTTRSTAGGHQFGTRLFNMFTGIAGTLAAWNDARVTRNALSKLSAHELDDLGLTRGDIENMRNPLRRF